MGYVDRSYVCRMLSRAGPWRRFVTAFPEWVRFAAPLLFVVLACGAIFASLWKVGARVSTTVEHKKERGSI
jgi:hypothetical protein